MVGKGVDRRIFLSWSTPKVVHIRVGIRYHISHARWVNRLQLIHCDASKYDVLHLRTVISLISLSTPCVSGDFLNSFLKTVTKNMTPSLQRDSSRYDINYVITASHGLVWVLGHAFCE